jgi:hypothetical protein
MFVLPPRDPNERREPPALELGAPVAVFLADLPSIEADRIAAAVLNWRPGALVVAAP